MVQKLAWLILSAIHALPALALLRPSLLTTLYGVSPGDRAFLLLHHRAALFAAVFAACIIAAFDPPSRRLAAVVAAISMVAFLIIWQRAGTPDALRQIALADLAGLPILAFAAYSAFAGSDRS